MTLSQILQGLLLLLAKSECARTVPDTDPKQFPDVLARSDARR